MRWNIRIRKNFFYWRRWTGRPHIISPTHSCAFTVGLLQFIFKWRSKSSVCRISFWARIKPGWKEVTFLLCWRNFFISGESIATTWVRAVTESAVKGGREKGWSKIKAACTESSCYKQQASTQLSCKLNKQWLKKKNPNVY